MKSGKVAHTVDARGIPVVIPASPQQTSTPRSQRYRPPRFDDDECDEVRVCRVRPDRNSLLEVYDYYQDPQPLTHASQLRLFYRHSPHRSSSQPSDSLQDAPTEPLHSPSATPIRSGLRGAGGRVDSSPLRPAPGSRKRPRDASSPVGMMRTAVAPLSGFSPMVRPGFNNRLSALLQEQQQQQQQQQQQLGEMDSQRHQALPPPSKVMRPNKPHLMGGGLQIHTASAPPAPVAAPTPSPIQSSPAPSPVRETMTMLTPPNPSPPSARQKQLQTVASMAVPLPPLPPPALPEQQPSAYPGDEQTQQRQKDQTEEHTKGPGEAVDETTDQAKENRPAADEERQELDPDVAAIYKKIKKLPEYYDIGRKIGEGTFSTVYKAVDLRYDQYDNKQWQKQLLAAHRLVKPDADEQSIAASSRQVALKRIYCTSSPARIANEISILQDLRGCTCVAPLITAFRQAEEFFIVMPYIEHDDFRHIYQTMTADDIRCYMRTLLTGLEHLHAQNIIHRDVKPNNFLYSYQRRSGILIDFGLAERIKPRTCTPSSTNQPTPQQQPPPPPAPAPTHPPPTLRRSNSSFLKSISLNDKENVPQPDTNDGKTREAGYLKNDRRRGIAANRAGTKGFRAPEILFREVNQTGAIDIWSAGVILISLLTRRYPFFLANDDADALIEIASLFGTDTMKAFASKMDRIFDTNIPTIPHKPRSLLQVCKGLNDEKLSTWASSDLASAVDLLEKCLTVDSNERITAEKALQHAFLRPPPSSSSSSSPNT